MAPSRHDWKIVDWDVNLQHNQPTNKKKKSKTMVSNKNIKAWLVDTIY